MELGDDGSVKHTRLARMLSLMRLVQAPAYEQEVPALSATGACRDASQFSFLPRAGIIAVEDSSDAPAWGIVMKMMREAAATDLTKSLDSTFDGDVSPGFEKIVVLCVDHPGEECLANIRRAPISVSSFGRAVGNNIEDRISFVDIDEALFRTTPATHLNSQNTAEFAMTVKTSIYEKIDDDCKSILFVVDSANVRELGDSTTLLLSAIYMTQRELIVYGFS